MGSISHFTKEYIVFNNEKFSFEIQNLTEKFFWTKYQFQETKFLDVLNFKSLHLQFIKMLN